MVSNTWPAGHMRPTRGVFVWRTSYLKMRPLHRFEFETPHLHRFGQAKLFYKYFSELSTTLNQFVVLFWKLSWFQIQTCLKSLRRIIPNLILRHSWPPSLLLFAHIISPPPLLTLSDVCRWFSTTKSLRSRSASEPEIRDGAILRFYFWLFRHQMK